MMNFPKLTLTNNPHYVSFFPRFLATVIDSLIYSIWIPLAVWYLASSTIDTILTNLIMAAALIIFPTTIFALVSRVLLLVTTGQTVGKMVVGIQVLNAKKEFLTWKRVLFRETLGHAVSGYVLGAGYFSIFFDPNHQGWHDHFVGSFVYEKKKNLHIAVILIVGMLIGYFMVISTSVTTFKQGLLPELQTEFQNIQREFMSKKE